MIEIPLSKDNLGTYIATLDDRRISKIEPRASVVIVSYYTNRELIRCLDSLSKSNIPDFETLLVDNGGNDEVLSELRALPLFYIRLKRNYRPSLARNIGTAFARSEIVIFLDDDALADTDFVSQHLMAHKRPQTLGVRGRVLPKSNILYNKLALMYDLGDKVVPSYIDLEGNASFPRWALMEVGGFNPEVFAGEGAELSYRLVQRFGGRENLLYWPGAVIYHDYAASLRKYLRKTLRGVKMQSFLAEKYPGFWPFIESYHPLPQGSISRPHNFNERVKLTLVRRMGRLVNRFGLSWYRLNPPARGMPKG